MNKSWIFKNESANEANLFIYGDITKEEWVESDTSSDTFAKALQSCGGKNINLHINSGGGDVFEALAMHNCLKNYSGKIFVFVEGICASAATIVACAGDKISMAENSLYMLHNPSVGLMGYFDNPELDKVQASLTAIKSTLIQTYKNRSGKTDKEISKLLDAETWYTAKEALENKFIDEISGSIDSTYDSSKKILFVNKLKVDCRKFDNEQITRKVADKMESKNFWEKLKGILSAEKNPDSAEDIRAKEIERIKNLNALRSDSAAANALIDLAISDGKSADEIKNYVDAVKNVPDVRKELLKLVEDNLNSGAEGVTDSVSPQNLSEADKRKASADLIAKFQV